ncbi:hypothetical protein EX895_000057 [Sporisorium graminicola]|uniref:RING-type domain-containing protein n=1 Tax=Sporisorium graminicola TaxID=280036 RepID=A0A4V6EUB2_9BASI|nr:hypothetical protein EX895_000057 [Sporisorium graminicola]TKY90059.1 hypothetical protein EX895_000057 [Sporisorium graminicola]
MLPSLALSSSSLDQFRKTVYRPRLCLLLLLVLLSPYNTRQLASSSEASTVSSSQPHQPGWSISVIDGFVVAAAPPASSSSALPKASSKTSSNPKAEAASTRAKAAPSAAPSAKDSQDSSAPQQGQPPPGSLFRFPKLSWGLIVDEHVLPALLLLHLLWAIRLAGMAVEDGLVKTSLLGCKSRFYSVTLPLVYLGVLALVAIVTGQPATVATIRSRCYVWRNKLGFEVSDPLSFESERKSFLQAGDLLPSSLFVMLETASTIVHLLSVLPKVDATSITNILPEQLRLPSPSHLPPLVELLPLPQFIKAALTEPVTSTATARYARNRRPMMPSISAGPAGSTAPGQESPQQQQQTETGRANAPSFSVEAPSSDGRANESSDMLPQQVYRRVGAPENEVLRSTSVARPIAPLQLPDNDPSTTQDSVPSSASRRRRAPRMRGQSVLVSTKWISETATALFDKVIGVLIYAIITLRLPTLTPTSLPPVLSLLSLRSELASLTQIWSKARSSVECLEFVRRRWGVLLEQGQDPYTSVSRPRAAAAAGDYQWKSYDDVYCAICFEQTRSAGAASTGSDTAGDKDDIEPKKKFEFCRLDCGHELHDVCLVSWLTAQAFCPTCHVVLSFSPRTATASRRSASQG